MANILVDETEYDNLVEENERLKQAISANKDGHMECLEENRRLRGASDNAKNRWCPWRTLEYVKPGRGIANNRIEEGFELGSGSRCIADECMAWDGRRCIKLTPNVQGQGDGQA